MAEITISCRTGKIQYGSAAAARRENSALRKRGRKNLNAYVCPYCSAWHLGRKPGKKKPVEIPQVPDDV